ncbi:MAG TPA: hypothetical protein VIM84_03325 [Gemmatimonadales bacterium]
MGRKSRSGRRSREVSSPKAAPASQPGRRGKSVSALPRELADFLVEFSIVLHKRSMYPAGHPHLKASADRFVQRLQTLLQSRDAVTLGVARHRLVLEAGTTDANNALLRDLAHRLHRHRIASVNLSAGITLDQIEGLLNALSADPQRGEGPVGKRLDRVGPWTHIRLRAAGYDKFELREDAEDPEEESGTEENQPAPRDSWLELARLALSSDQNGASADVDPVSVAEAIGRKSGEVAYDRVVLGYLSRIAEEMSRGGGKEHDQLAQRISKLLGAMNHDTLRRLLRSSTDQAERRKFVLNASQILAADAVLEVVKAAAQASDQTISHSLLRLLHKLADHTKAGPVAIRAEADGALRTNVARLIEDWALEDPNPSQYNVILEGMVRRASTEHSVLNIQLGCDPEVIIRMAQELDCIGPPVLAAADQLLAGREMPRLARALDSGPRTSAVERLWQYVATPERLEHELAATPLDQEAVTILVDRIGARAAGSLLDRLESATDRSTRAAIMKQLLALGPGIGPVALARLPDAPWYFQRNILVLLGRLGSWPEGFSPAAYVTSSDARVRREAVKIMLESEARRGEGVLLGLRDADETIVALALAVAQDSCPAPVVPLIQRIATDPRRPSESRVLAIRALARSGGSATPEVLRGLVMHPRRWLGRRLAPKSPELLAALAGLASHWSKDPAAAEVLVQAREHSDAEIRAAAGGTAG